MTITSLRAAKARVRAVSVDVSILTSGHDVADARLHKVTAGLQRAGLSVEILALGTAKDAPLGVTARVRPRPGLAGRALLALTLPWKARGTTLLVLDPDALLGARLANLVRPRRLVADVHEDYAALLRDRPWARGAKGAVARTMVRAATAAARGCELTVVADDHVPPIQAAHRLVVRNEPDPSFLPSGVLPSQRPHAVYVGDVRRTRGLAAMLDALEGAPSWTLDVVGPVARDDQAWLAHRLEASPSLADRVRWHGRLTPRRSWEVAAGAWAGLCLLEPTPAFVDAVPSKLYEYLVAGIVPIVSDLPRQRQLVGEAGSGIVAGDPAAAAAALVALENDPLERLRASGAGRSWAASRSWVDSANRTTGNTGTVAAAGYDRLGAAVREMSLAGSDGHVPSHRSHHARAHVGGIS
jgi:glycosyltransferase involved in cell wall biosynthesis